MLGENGMRWLERLHMQIARELRAKEWSQAEIANILGTTQSTISRQYTRPLPELAGTADELMIDGWATEISNALRVYGPEAKLTKQRFVVELAFGPGQILQFNKSLTGIDLESGQNPFGTADSTATFPDEVFFIDRKSAENRAEVVFELAASFDLDGVRLPKRQVLPDDFPGVGTFF